MTARPRFGACVLSCVVGVLGLVACGEEGMSVANDTCPELVVYDINDPASVEAARAARQQAERAGCITTIGTAVTDPSQPPPSATGGGSSTPVDGGGAGGTAN